jgi:hypothetical protein
MVQAGKVRPAMRVLFVNPSSGGADALEDVKGAADERGIAVRDLRELDAGDADVIARARSGARARA